MLREKLRNREGFLQGIEARNIGNHYHSSMEYKDIVLFTGRNTITSLTDLLVGQIIPVDPIYFIEATKAKLYLTIAFTSGGIDSYTTSLYVGTLMNSTTSTTSVATGLIEINISEDFKKLFKSTEEKEMYLMCKVSNAATPVTIMGATIRVFTTSRDSFGSSQSKVSQYMGNSGLVEKDYLVNKLLEEEELEYISEIPDEFGSR